MIMRAGYAEVAKYGLIGDADFSMIPGDELNREEALMATDTKNDAQLRLRSAVSSLSKKQQLILELRFSENLSYDEIAARMGMKYQSINNLLFRTLRRLRYAMTHVLFLVLLIS